MKLLTSIITEITLQIKEVSIKMIFVYRLLERTKIVLPPTSGRFIKASTAEFLCGVSNDPIVTVTWQWVFRGKFSTNDQILTSGSRHSIAADGKLTISGVLPADIGNYTCNVYSAGGNDTRSVSLEVIGMLFVLFFQYCSFSELQLKKKGSIKKCYFEHQTNVLKVLQYT